MSINYVIGDATYPQGPGPKVIAHCVNDLGKWGSGFVLALNKQWTEPRNLYFQWSRGLLLTPFNLGEVQFVQVESELWVANIIGQHQTIRENPSPIRYDALRIGLRTTAQFCLNNGASLHAPRLGSGLARGDWNTIEQIIEEEVVSQGISVTIYDLK